MVNARRRRGRNKSDRAKSEEKSPDIEEESGRPNATISYRPHDTLLIQLDEASPTWYECGKNLSGRDATIVTHPPQSGTHKVNNSLTLKYRSLADSIYRREIQLNGGTRSSNDSDERWVENTIRKGTLKDRIAAMSVIISSDPVHKLHALDGLLQMAGCSDLSNGKSSNSRQVNSRVAALASEALEDIFLNTLLPPHRKLLTMDQRPLYLLEQSSTGDDNDQKQSSISSSPRILLLWRFEEMVKEKYQSFLRGYFHHTLREGLDISKVSALRTAGTLLRSVPEGEAEILTLMVNKLGDPGKKTAAAAGHELRRVLREHPAMQAVVAREVQQLVHRPHCKLIRSHLTLNDCELNRIDSKSCLFELI